MVKVLGVAVLVVLLAGSFGKVMRRVVRNYDDDDVGQDDTEAEEEHATPKSQIVTVGDMLLTLDQYHMLYSNETIKRHGLKRSFQHWPDGIVTVKISAEFDETYKSVIMEAMKYIENISCVRFTLDGEQAPNFLNIVPDRGCSSSVGFLRAGAQPMKLSSQYCTKGNVIHELLHTLGFFHMHTAVDRDQYVKINYKNIQPSAIKNFDKTTFHVSMFNTQYDYRSIMHYGEN